MDLVAVLQATYAIAENCRLEGHAIQTKDAHPTIVADQKLARAVLPLSQAHANNYAFFLSFFCSRIFFFSSAGLGGGFVPLFLCDRAGGDDASRRRRRFFCRVRDALS